MATKEQYASSVLYANIMAEVKYRIAAIDSATTGQTKLAPTFVREFCYLQLRMICELVALGCLVAHGDIKATKSKALMKEWSAEAISNALSDLHPDFFPLAVREHQPFGPKHRPIEPISPQPMTKTDFLALYGQCGGVLHKGNLKKLMKEQMPLQVNYPEITAKAQRFVDLLSLHIVPMLGGQMFFICLLSNASDSGKVQVAIAESGKDGSGDPTSDASPSESK